MKIVSIANMRNRVDPGLILALLLTLFNIIPLARNPGLPDGTDVLLHSFRVAEMQRSWDQGLYFPSWAEGLYYGYGSPLFHFYASLAYYLTSLLNLLFGLSVLETLRWLLLLCLLTCSGGMYLFCKRRSGRLGALVGGLLYVYSPFLMYTETYARGAYPELLAFALFPLLLWRVDALRDKPNAVNFLLVVLLQVALINAHNLMALTLTAIIFAWVISETLIQQFNRESSQIELRPALLASLALLLGILGSAMFWLPVLLENDSLHWAEPAGSGLLDYRENFVSLEELLSPPPINDAGAINGLRELRILGIAQWASALVGAAGSSLLYIRGYRSRHPQTFLGCALFGLLALVLVALITPAARPVWDAIRPLQFLQFPWRLLGPTAACLAIVASMNGLWLSRLQLRFQISSIVLLIALPITTVIPLLYVPEWRHPTLDSSVAAFHEEEKAGRLLGTVVTDEFRPRDVYSLPSPTAHLLSDYADGYPIDKLNRSILPASAEAELIHNSPQSNEWRIQTAEAFLAEVYIFYWLGWRAELEDRPVKILPSLHHGLITVPLPAGEYSLRVYLGSTPARDVAAAVSAIAIAFACIAAFFLRKSQPTPRPYWSAPPLTRNAIYGILLGAGIAVLCHLIVFS